MDYVGHGVAKSWTRLSDLNSFLGFSNLMPITFMKKKKNLFYEKCSIYT